MSQPTSTQRRRFGGLWNGIGIVWVLALLLVAVASVVASRAIDQAAARADRERLDRGAQAIKHSLETEIGTLKIVIDGVNALSAGDVSPRDLASAAGIVDSSLLDSLVGLVSYPVTEQGVGAGQLLMPLAVSEGPDAPDLAITADQARDMIAHNVPFLSAPYRETGDPAVRIVAVTPTRIDGEAVMVGAIFRIDGMLERANTAAGKNEYAASLVDTRHNDDVIITVGHPIGEATVRVAPVGLAGLVDVIVSPGPDFPFSASGWSRVAALGVGMVIVLLISALWWTTRALAQEMDHRLWLASEHDRGKDRFLATVSHELRTPLTVVLGAATEVRDPSAALSPVDRDELLDMVVEQATEATAIVEDLLVAARSEYGHIKLLMAPTRLQPHLVYAAEWIPVERRDSFTMTEKNPAILADGTRLRQILRNLLQNAVRHGGPSIVIQTSTEDETVRVSVLDNGPLMEPEMRERIFEPYTQVSDDAARIAQGVGVGLYVSRLLARLMDGDLVCLRSGEWNEFRLTLPVDVSAATRDQRRANIT